MTHVTPNPYSTRNALREMGAGAAVKVGSREAILLDDFQASRGSALMIARHQLGGVCRILAPVTKAIRKL
jgi:hypothetical protein